MGRIRRGGYLIEWWIGDHLPKHVHVYNKGRMVARIRIPEMLVLKGRVSGRLREILKDLMRKGKL